LLELLSPWDENGRVMPNAIPYNKSYDEIMKNHCLSIMVKNERVVSQEKLTDLF
jgi:hypothetical protein